MKYISSFPTHNEAQVPLTKKCVFIVSTPSLPCGKLNFRYILLSTAIEWKQNISGDTTTRRILRTSSFKIMPQRRKFHSQSRNTSTTIFKRVQRRFESFLRVKELLISRAYNRIRRKIVITGIPWSESRKIYRVGFMVHYNFQFEFATRRKWTPGNKIKLGTELERSDWLLAVKTAHSLHWQPVKAGDMTAGLARPWPRRLSWMVMCSLHNYLHISDILYSHKFRQDTTAFLKRVSDFQLHDLAGPKFLLYSSLIKNCPQKQKLSQWEQSSECCSGGGS